jgi:Carboxypeptidase regulatory-like domain/TonB-dependent Receptor Plug Domain
VHSTLRTLSIVAIVAIAGGPLCSAPAFAQAATIATDAHAQTIAQSANQQSSIIGTVTSAGGQRLGDATVTASGPARVTVHSDANGAFTITGPPGLYTLVVSHGGYDTASTEIATIGGATTTANVSLAETSLSTLSTIGRTSTSYNNVGARFNISSSAEATLSTATIANRETPALTTLLQEMPGITVSQSATSVGNNFIIHGLGVETKTTLDGHPVSSGISGTYTGNYTGSGLVGGVDVLYGAGLNGPTAGQAGVGTVNIRTPDFTAKDSGSITSGIDSFGGTMYTALADINFLKDNRLSLIVGKSFSGYRGPSYNKNEDVIDSALNGSVVPQTFSYATPSLSNTDVEGVYDMSNTYVLNDELAKLRYQFSSATSVTAEYLGFYGQYQPQGGAYAQYVGQLTVPQCVNKNGSAYTGVPAGGTGCGVTSIYNAPSAQNQVGSTQSLYTFYPGSAVRYSQPSLNLDFRTTYKNDTILFRPYTADITRNIDGTGESAVPGNHGGWYEVTNSANCQVAFVAPTTANGGAKGPCFAAGAPNGYTPYVIDPNTPHSFGAQGSTALTCSLAAPCYTTTTQQNNGGQYGYGTPYSTNEYDHLNGYLHPSIRREHV